MTALARVLATAGVAGALACCTRGMANSVCRRVARPGAGEACCHGPTRYEKCMLVPADRAAGVRRDGDLAVAELVQRSPSVPDRRNECIQLVRAEPGAWRPN